MLIEWNDRYATGVEDIDHEHRELIDLINTLHRNLGEEAGSETVAAFFGDLLKGISAHFALEERLMRQAKYEHFEAHKTDHEDLLDQLRDMMDVYEETPQGFAAEPLSAALDSWFTEHFRVHDALLHNVLGPHAHG